MNRKRHWDIEDSKESDRGRRKKVKTQNFRSYNNSCSSGYNAFQKRQEQIYSRHWKSPPQNRYRFYINSNDSGKFRSSNSFSSHQKLGNNNFKRYNNKFHHRSYQQREYNFHRG